MRDLGLKLVPFQVSMLRAAAELLATKHKRSRSTAPLLPQQFMNPDVAELSLTDLLKKPGSSGVAAFSRGKLVGYLIGQLASDTLRGRHVWIHPQGFALDEAWDAETYRDLYAYLGAIWVENGFFDHLILVPSGDPTALSPWLHLGFSLEQVHALLDLHSLRVENFPQNPKLLVRQASADDRELVRSFSQIISQAHAGPPVWGVSLPEDIPEVREGYGELLDEEGTVVWLALLAKQAVGIQVYRTLHPTDSSLLIPRNCCRLTVASTKPEARGQGVSTTLLAHGLFHARSQGFDVCETDWRATHLLSSRHWPKFGFQPCAYRLVRKVDPRIVWANGYNEIDLSIL